MENISPKIWGKSSWIYLHCVAKSFPVKPTKEEENRYKIFFESLLLPCSKCQTNYSTDLKSMPLTDTILSSKDNFLKWWVNMRNSANNHIGKGPKTLEEYDQEVLSNSLNKNSNGSMWPCILIIIMLCVFLIFYNKNYFKSL